MARYAVVEEDAAEVGDAGVEVVPAVLPLLQRAQNPLQKHLHPPLRPPQPLHLHRPLHRPAEGNSRQCIPVTCICGLFAFEPAVFLCCFMIRPGVTMLIFGEMYTFELCVPNVEWDRSIQVSE